jgi:arylsulfatase A-like enzyme
MYKDQPEYERNFYGCITAMDEQVGRLRKELRDLGVADNTMLWFCSDNGPEGQANNAPGTTAGLRGRKRDLFEGGVRVPGLLEWPARFRQPLTTDVPCCTSDYFPTICSALGIGNPEGPEPIDGIDLMPLLEGRMTERPRPIAFESRNRLALIDNRYKIVSTDNGESYMLFDIVADPGEKDDLAAGRPDVLNAMREQLERWRDSCGASRDGEDYDGGNA